MSDTPPGGDWLRGLQSRAAGGLVGLLVGDALGVPYEFHAAQDIPSCEQIEYAPPAGFSRSHAGVAPGTWSDDGAQALCLLESLLECGRMDQHDFAERLLRWYENGHLAVDGVVFDVGVATGRALLALRSGTPPAVAGESAGEYSNNGNGSLMRMLPLALWHAGSDEELVRDACSRKSLMRTRGRRFVARCTDCGRDGFCWARRNPGTKRWHGCARCCRDARSCWRNWNGRCARTTSRTGRGRAMSWTVCVRRAWPAPSPITNGRCDRRSRWGATPIRPLAWRAALPDPAGGWMGYRRVGAKGCVETISIGHCSRA